MPRSDYRLFEKMDTDHSGHVTLPEWTAFIRATHAERCKKHRRHGDAWLATLFFNLRRGCGQTELTEEQLRRAEVGWG